MSDDTTPKPRRRGGVPPVEHRFPPGVSGNPGGRPKKKPTLRETALEILHETVPDPRGNGTITGRALLMHAAISQAMRNPKHLMQFVRFLEGDRPVIAAEESEVLNDPDVDQAIVDAALARMARRREHEEEED